MTMTVIEAMLFEEIVKKTLTNYTRVCHDKNHVRLRIEM